MIRADRAGIARATLTIFTAALIGCLTPDAPSEAVAAKPKPRPSVIIISLDTVRSDRLPIYGYDGIETPGLDALRRDGLLYQRAYSPVPLTTPAHATLLTGLQPPEHGIRDNSGYRYDPARGDTMATRLREAGYSTAAFVSSFTLRRAVGLDHGFDHYDDELPDVGRATIGEIQRRGDATFDRARSWIESTTDPFFALIHVYDPHTPWEPPEPYASQYGETYEAEIAFVDGLVGRLMSWLRATGRYDDTAVIVLSDHGEGLDDHGEEEHGILLYRESLQIPLVVKLPGSRRAGDTVEAPAQLMDVMPTVLELAGLDGADELPGRSLLALGPGDTDRAVYAETYYPHLRFGWSALRSLMVGDHHYIHGPAPELYDLKRDPGETTDVLREERSRYLDLRRQLESIDENLERPFSEDAGTRDALASLGYLGGGGTSAAAGQLDPKTQLHTLEPIREGIQALQSGDLERAVVVLTRATEQSPGLFDAWQFLGVAYQEQGRWPEAYDAFREAFRLSDGAPSIGLGLARATVVLDKREEAIPLLQAAITNYPDQAELHFHLTRFLILEGRYDEALEAADATLAVAPGQPDAHYQRGVVMMALQRGPEAKASFERALQIAPNHVPAMSDLAVLAVSAGQVDFARELLRRVLELQPDNGRAAEMMRQLESSP